jgi:hypothetical protein
MTQLRRKKSNKRNSLGALYDRRDRALERLVAVVEKYRANGVPPKEDSVFEEDELSMALDALTIAHFAVTFEFVSGPHKW